MALVPCKRGAAICHVSATPLAVFVQNQGRSAGPALVKLPVFGQELPLCRISWQLRSAAHHSRRKGDAVRVGHQASSTCKHTRPLLNQTAVFTPNAAHRHKYLEQMLFG